MFSLFFVFLHEKLMSLGKYNNTLTRFVLVGVVNTLFGMAIMFVLYNVFGVSYWWSSAANYFFGSILSFILNKQFTFKHKGHLVGSAFKFVICIVVCYVVAYGVAKPLMTHLLKGSSITVQENVAMLVGAVLFTALNYLGQRFFAFKEKEG